MASRASSSRNPSPESPDSIYHLTHDIHQTVTRSIDTALSWEQLNSPSVNYTLVRPIVERFAGKQAHEIEKKDREDLLHPDPEVGWAGESEETGDVRLGSVLYALMANR